LKIHLSYGIPTDKEAIQIRFGIHKGFFLKEGIDLELRIVFGGPEIAKAYDKGSLVIGEMGSPPAIVAMQNGSRFKIVASSIRQRALQYFVARPDIQSWEQLRGKTLAALSIGSCSYWFLRQVLLSRGLNPDQDVEIIGLGENYPKVVDLFHSGQITGAILSEPNVSIGESADAFVVKESLTAAEFSPAMQWSVIVANDDFARRSPDVLKTTLRGIFRSYQYSNDNIEEFVDFSASYFSVSSSAIKRAVMREKDGLCLDGKIYEPALQSAIDLQYRLGAIKTKPLIDQITNLSQVSDL